MIISPIWVPCLLYTSGGDHTGALYATADTVYGHQPCGTLTSRIAGCLLGGNDVGHALRVQRDKVQTVAGIKVGGDGLGVVIDQDGFAAVLLQGPHTVHRAVAVSYTHLLILSCQRRLLLPFLLKL